MKKKPVSYTTPIDNSKFNKAHVINKQTYTSTFQTNKQQQQQHRSHDETNNNYNRKQSINKETNKQKT